MHLLVAVIVNIFFHGIWLKQIDVVSRLHFSVYDNYVLDKIYSFYFLFQM